MARSTLGRDYDINGTLGDHQRRILALERRLAALSYLTPDFTSTQACRVTRSVALSIPNASFTTIPFNVEVFDDTDMHSAVNSSRITIAIPGYYDFGMNVQLQANNDYTRMILSIIRNGSDRLLFTDRPGTPLNAQQRFSAAGMDHLEAGDYIEAQVFQQNSSVAARNVEVAAGYSPHFWAARIGGQ